MAVRTPGLQSRNSVHRDWGNHTYTLYGPSPIPTWPAPIGRSADDGSAALPNTPGNLITATEFTKLEAGDVAATVSVSTVGEEVGRWFCVHPGTFGVGAPGVADGNAVWCRVDNVPAINQTIRDAHMIVVGRAGSATSTLAPGGSTLLDDSLEIASTSNVAGVSCDILDQGNCHGIDLALSVAAALMGQVALPLPGVDVRVRAGEYTRVDGLLVSVPERVRFIGAGDGTVISSNAALGTIDLAAAGSGNARVALEDMTVISVPGTAAPAHAAVRCTTLGTHILVKNVRAEASVLGARGFGVNGLGIRADYEACTFDSDYSPTAIPEQGFAFGTAEHIRLESCRSNGARAGVAFGPDATLCRAEVSNFTTAARQHGFEVTPINAGRMQTLRIEGGDVYLNGDGANPSSLFFVNTSSGHAQHLTANGTTVIFGSDDSDNYILEALVSDTHDHGHHALAGVMCVSDTTAPQSQFTPVKAIKITGGTAAALRFYGSSLGCDFKVTGTTEIVDSSGSGNPAIGAYWEHAHPAGEF